ncbi:MAG: insulinase family protein, partial [Saprospiraceae bacterium]|nr:insulinase family protein [Saprospiraceae bacterium]
MKIQIASILILLAVWACSPKLGTQTATSPMDSEPMAAMDNEPQMADAPMADAPEEAVTTPDDVMMQEVPMDPRVRTGVLDNGLRYYIQKNKKPEQRAEIRLAVAAGSINEDDDQLGLAHFVEHMAFNGTKHFEKSELVDYLQSVGTKFGPDLNAYTSFDETVYMLQIRTDSQDLFDKGMLILEDWAHAVTFEDEEIDKERGVVESELRSGLSAEERMSNQYLPVIFYKSKYAERLPIGTREVINNAPYDAFKRFYRDWYRPDLMAVVVVGDIDVDGVEADIKSRFSVLENPTNPREREKYGFPDHEETLVSITKDEEATFTTARVMYKHKNKKVKTVADYRRTLLQSLYNRMLNNRL